MKYIVAILIFGLIIFIHELGHFLLAKKNGIYVEEFSIGMGPRLWGFKKGETRYSLKLLPLGGSCMMLGEDEASQDDRAFGNKPVWGRIAVVFAGPFFNFLLAFILAVILIAMVGADTPKIAKMEPNSAASEAGLQKGDVITKLDDTSIYNFREISLFMYMNKDGKAIDVTYERDGKKETTVVTPKYNEQYKSYLLGINSKREKVSIGSNLKYSCLEVRYWIKTVVLSLKMMVTGKVTTKEVAGPVGIVNIIGDTYDESAAVGIIVIIQSMLNISIMLSANLGVMNLLPLPALDGGRLVFLIIEAIRGKKVDPNKEGMVHFIGFVLLMLLMVFIMFNDIKNVFF